MNNLVNLYSELYAMVLKMHGELNGQIIHQKNPRIFPESGDAILKRMVEDGRATTMTNGNIYIFEGVACEF